MSEFICSALSDHISQEALKSGKKKERSKQKVGRPVNGLGFDPGMPDDNPLPTTTA